jgi:hypothetical protein
MSGFTDRSLIAPTTVEERQRKLTLTCWLLRSEDKSVLVRDAAGVEAWLARSLITIEGDLSVVTITLPAWLAAEKGLRAFAEESGPDLFNPGGLNHD